MQEQECNTRILWFHLQGRTRGVEDSKVPRSRLTLIGASMAIDMNLSSRRTTNSTKEVYRSPYSTEGPNERNPPTQRAAARVRRNGSYVPRRRRVEESVKGEGYVPSSNACPFFRSLSLPSLSPPCALGRLSPPPIATRRTTRTLGRVGGAGKKTALGFRIAEEVDAGWPTHHPQVTILNGRAREGVGGQTRDAALATKHVDAVDDAAVVVGLETAESEVVEAPSGKEGIGSGRPCRVDKSSTAVDSMVPHCGEEVSRAREFEGRSLASRFALPKRVYRGGGLVDFAGVGGTCTERSVGGVGGVEEGVAKGRKARAGCGIESNVNEAGTGASRRVTGGVASGRRGLAKAGGLGTTSCGEEAVFSRYETASWPRDSGAAGGKRVRVDFKG
ncbi:hypothetical protein R3P38DRAFT_3347197 [Favolaschia claudopus]|uniref:Uncharacterized protein n=1 Tax=Favolaschia claudopus TaxID=2862362 RepID=A0AAW0D106_9AGAR